MGALTKSFLRLVAEGGHPHFSFSRGAKVMTKRLVVLGGVAAACIGGGIAWRIMIAGAAPPPAAPPSPAPVVAAKVQVSDVPIVLEGIGTVAA
jgi:hypothetical protein